MTISRTAPESAVTHFFTVDVEEYFQVGAFEHVISRDSWEHWPSRADASVDLLLDLLERHGVKATCFVLGWFAQRHPAVVRRLADAGHEIASHGWSHRSLVELTPAQFATELRTSKDLLEQIAGQRVAGFRAPNFSIVPGLEWAFDVLIDEGYRFDSSLFANRHRPASGFPGARTTVHHIRRPNGRILEVPLAVRGWMGRPVPASGGGYFRLLPYAVTRRAFAELSARGVPGVFYIHPWELDARQPRVAVALPTRVRHYTGIRRASQRLERMLSEFSFTSIAAHPAAMS